MSLRLRTLHKNLTTSFSSLDIIGISLYLALLLLHITSDGAKNAKVTGGVDLSFESF